MKKLTLLALAGEKANVFKTLARLRSVHIDVSPEYENTTAFEQNKDEVETKLHSIFNAINTVKDIKKKAIAFNKFALDETKSYKKALETNGEQSALETNYPIYSEFDTVGKEYTQPKKQLFSETPVFTFDSFSDIILKEKEIIDNISLIENANKRLIDIKAELVKLSLLKNQLTVYRKVDAKFSSVKESKNTGCILGVLPSSFANSFCEKINNIELASCVIVKDIYNMTSVFIAYHKTVKTDVMTLLGEAGVSLCPFDFDLTASEKINEINVKMNELGKESKELAFSFADTDVQDMQTLYDYYSLEYQKLVAAEKCRTTSSVFLMTAWVPVTKEEQLETALTEMDSVIAYELTEPTDNDNPPTYIKQDNKAVDSFQSITNMYSVPNYRDRDPNFFVAIFYFVFFGMMLGDVGYGLIVSIACFTIYGLQKKTKRPSKMMYMFGWCGISMVLWGVVYGSVFGAAVINMVKTADGTMKPLLDCSGQDVMLYFVLSLGVGAIQLAVGFALGGIDKARKSNGTIMEKTAIVINNYAWVVLFVALFLISPIVMDLFGATVGLAEKTVTMVTVGKYVAFGGVGLLVLGGILGKKNPIKMLMGVFGNFYGAINVLSDVLSYSRLFGLGLTSCIIGFVVNQLGSIIVNMVGGAWWGWIIAAPILVLGHVLNVGINILGTYVHDARLQFIEFFGHFFDGGGYSYLPLGSDLKYTYIEEK